MTAMVIGYGNTLRGDDGAGPYVASRIAELRADVGVVQTQQLTPELAIDLARVDLAIFVDVRADEPERGVAVEEVVDSAGGSSSHHVSPGSLLLVARRLFGHAPKAYLVSVPAYSFDYSESLSPDTMSAAEAAVDLTIRLIEREMA